MVVGGRELVAVGALDERRTPSARIVARAGTLDLDYVGAEIGEDLPRPRAGQDARELKNTNARERSRQVDVS